MARLLSYHIPQTHVPHGRTKRYHLFQKNRGIKEISELSYQGVLEHTVVHIHCRAFPPPGAEQHKLS